MSSHGNPQGDVPYRTLGRTGDKVSIIGVGGYHIGSVADEQEAIRIVRTALDNGVNFLDNAWDYHDGVSEIRVGKALKDGYRQEAFVMTKTDGQTRESAAQQIDESLRRLQVDVIDLLQFHEVIRPGDPDRIFAPGGAIEAAVKARDDGKIRYIGFTGHKDPSVHLKMLDTAFAHGFTFDSVQMPLNVMDAHYRSFEKEVLPVLVQHGIAVLGMKPMAAGNALRSGKVSAVECLRYALNLPTSVVITGIDSMAILQQALEAARTFRPLTQDEVAELLARTNEVATTGEFEPFKTTLDFDATTSNPEWLG